MTLWEDKRPPRRHPTGRDLARSLTAGAVVLWGEVLVALPWLVEGCTP